MLETRRGFSDFSSNLPINITPDQIFESGGVLYANIDSGLWYFDTSTSSWLRKRGPASASQYTAMTLVGSFLYICENTAVHLIDLSTGRNSILAGRIGSSGSTDGTGGSARFSSLSGISYDGTSLLYVTDNQMVRTVTTATGLVTTLAGVAATTGTTDATGAAARFNFPTGCVWVSSVPALFIADKINHSIRKCTSGGVVTTHAGLNGTLGSTNGTLANSRYNSPCDITLLGTNFYVMDTGNAVIRTVPLAGSTADLVSFSGQISITNDGTNLYASNNTGGNARISLITTSGVSSVVAGGSTSSTIVDGIGTSCRFSFSTTTLGNNLVNSSDRLLILDVINLGFNRTAIREMYYSTSYVYSISSGSRGSLSFSSILDGFISGPS